MSYRVLDFFKTVKAFTDGHGADVVFDIINGRHEVRYLRFIATDGRLVNIAFLDDSMVETDLMPMILKRLPITR